MSSGAKTTRDQLTLLVDLVRRTLRHTWLIALIAIVGAGLSVMLALMQKPVYDSETVLLYQEKISQSVLQGRDVAQGSRTMSARFREIVLSRTTLSSVIEEFNLYPEVVEEQGTIAAAEKLRLLVSFTDRGAGTFRISFRGDSPKQAQQVTARIAALLQAKDDAVRMEQAEQTKKFLMGEQADAENTLAEAESEFAAFVARHPEFVAENQVPGSSAVGASIRAANKDSAKRPEGTSRLQTLQRAAKRLRDRIDNPTGPVAPAPRPPRRVESPTLLQAREDLADAKRSYDDKSNRFTLKHPDVIAAKNNVDESTRRLKRIEASENAKPAPVIADITPTTSVAALREELARIEQEMSRLQDNDDPKASKNSIADELVTLETDHARLQRRVQVAAQRLSSLEGRVFTAEITSSSEFAEAAKLVIIDEAYLPAQPAGRGRKVVALAGTVVFILLGIGLALGLALIDDRIYRRADIDELGIAPVLVVVPKRKKQRRGFLRG